MSTPSKKLNQFLYANRQARLRIAGDMAVEREIPEDRDLTPETKAVLDETLAKLKSAGPAKVGPA